jgi:hypothetical protein
MKSSISISMPPPISSMPPPSKKRQREVLNEDEYTNAIGNIIEKRYFPDSSFNRSILNILEGGGNRRTKPSFNDNNDNEKRSTHISENLNEFFQKYTSEDNASFEEIHDNDIEAFKKKYHWAYSSNEEGKKEGMLMLYNIGGKKLNADERKEMDRLLNDDENTDNRKNMPETWRFRVRNQLVFPPTLADSEEICRVHESDEGGTIKPFPMLKNHGGGNLPSKMKTKNELTATATVDLQIQNSCTRLPTSSLLSNELRSPLEPPHTPSIYAESDRGSEAGDADANNYGYVEMTPIYVKRPSGAPSVVIKNSGPIIDNFTMETIPYREALARKLDAQNRSKKLAVVSSSSSASKKGRDRDTVTLTPAALLLAQKCNSSKMSSAGYAFDAKK